MTSHLRSLISERTTFPLRYWRRHAICIQQTINPFVQFFQRHNSRNINMKGPIGLIFHFNMWGRGRVIVIFRDLERFTED